MPHVSWPSGGQATIAVSGIGAIGRSGSSSSMPTASMAKAMTAYIVLRDHPLASGAQGPTLHVTRAEAAALPGEINTAQSVIPVRSGEALTERQAINALLLKSANNVARILARWDAGSVPAFLNKMNATAKQLGMAHTHSTDPSGWHASTVSTPSDQIRLADAAMRVSSFATTVATPSAVLPLAGWVRNTNLLLGSDGVVGVKTGSMSASGGCLMFAARIRVAGQPVTILGTVMGQQSASLGILHAAFANTRTLLRSFESVLAPYTVVRAGQIVGYVGPAHTPLRATKTVTAVGWRGMTVHGTIHATVLPTTAKGATVGTLRVTTGAVVPVVKG